MQILNVGPKIWEEITDHAKTCLIGEEVYMYTDRNLQQKSGVVFNVIGQVKGLLKESQYLPMNRLSDTDQACISRFLYTSISPFFYLSSLSCFMLFLFCNRRMPKN